MDTLPQLSPTKIRGVVFDLDGTLYDKRPLERHLALSMPWWIGRLLRYTRVRKSLAGEDFGSAQAIFAETRRRLASSARSQTRWQRWIDRVYDPGVLRSFARVVEPYPGVQQLLGDLRSAGLRLGLVSDYRGLEKRLALLGLAVSDFDFCMVTELEGAMKPAPRVIDRTRAGMGLSGGEMVMVGDRAFADETFAQAGGMAFLGVLAPGQVSAGPTWLAWPQLCQHLRTLCS